MPATGPPVRERGDPAVTKLHLAGYLTFAVLSTAVLVICGVLYLT